MFILSMKYRVVWNLEGNLLGSEPVKRQNQSRWLDADSNGFQKKRIYDTIEGGHGKGRGKGTIVGGIEGVWQTYDTIEE